MKIATQKLLPLKAFLRNFFFQKSTTSPTPRGRWSSLRRASKLPKMLGHPLKFVNKDLLPLDAWRMTGKGRISLILHRGNIRKMSYFLTTIFQHSISLITSNALHKSIVYIHPDSPFHSLTCVCVSPRKWGQKSESVGNEYTSSQHSNFLDSDKKPKTSNNPFWARNEKKNFAERPLGGSHFWFVIFISTFFPVLR